MPQAKTALEKVYCEVKTSDPSARLPNFNDFRRNPANIQRMLLKRPASRAGVQLPDGVGVRKKPVKVGSGSIKSVPKADKLADVDTQLVGCSFYGSNIQCPRGYYYPQNNLNNKKLRRGALAETNKLALPSEPQGEFNERAKRLYLLRSYEQYLIKMLDIGLGGSTMSFTKFYYVYEEGSDKGLSFSERFEKTFHFLKRDKASLAVKSSYGDKKPDKIELCLKVSSELITCDQNGINWVFLRKNT